MKRPGFLLRFALLLVFVGIASLTSYAAAREVSVFADKYTRRGSNNGGKFENGNDVVIQVDTNCAWLYLSEDSTPSAFWSNNISIFGTGYGYKNSNDDEVRELGGALRFGQGATTNTNPMILTGDVTFLGNATIGVQTKSPDAKGIITGELKLDASAPSDTTFLYRAQNARSSGSNFAGTLILTADSNTFTAPIQVGGGTLQIGYITDTVTATGWEWVPDGAGGETYKQNTAKQFVFDGSTGSVASSTINVTSVFSNEVATLKFQRAGSVTVNNAITGNGKVVFDGTATYTLGESGSLDSPLASVTVNENAKLIANQAISSPVQGQGTIQVNNPSTRTDMSLSNYSTFEGTLLVGSEFRATPSTDTPYDIGAVDNGQLWLQSKADYMQSNVYLSGTGWSSSERFGALRFARSESSETSMPNVTGTTHLLGDTNISSRYNNDATYGMISGDIDGGSYSLTIDSKGVNTGAAPASTTILTGTNTYGATNVNNKDTLVIGWIGTVNGKEYKGTTGTLGTGAATVAQDATLKFNRSGDVTIPNELGGTGTVLFDGTATYTVDPNKISADLGTVQVGQNSTLVLAGEISSDVSQRFTLTNPSNPVQISGSSINVTLSGGNLTTPSLTFGNDLNFSGTNTIDLAFEDGFTPQMGETYFLFSGTDYTMDRVASSTLRTLSPELPASTFWTYSVETLPGGGLALAASLATPEPAAWILLVLGTFIALIPRVHARRARSIF
ncbi:MAG: hypothetical protein K6C40_00470 [Thermoguttaceae bacterium]|nr:hypothetical protein [Thermoguttaceae bacterium]